MTTQDNNTSKNRNWLYAIAALAASLIGFLFYQSNDLNGEEGAVANATEQPTVPAPAQSAPAETEEPKATALEMPAEALEQKPEPVNQPPKPKKKAKEDQNVAIRQPAPMKYNPGDFKVNDFYENLRSAPKATMISPEQNALFIPDEKGNYFFQLGVLCDAKKDDRIEVFPNNKAAFDAEKPLWRMVFPDDHSGKWQQLIKLDGKAGLYYVVFTSEGKSRTIGKFTLN